MEVWSNKMKIFIKTFFIMIIFYASSYCFEDCLKRLKITDVKVYQFHVDKFKIDSTVVAYWVTKQLNDYGIKNSESKDRIYLAITVSTIAMEKLNGVMYSIRTEVLKPNSDDGSSIRYFFTDDYGLVSDQTYSDDIQNSIKDQIKSFIHSWVQANNIK